MNGKGLTKQRVMTRTMTPGDQYLLVLKALNGNRQAACAALGVTRQTVFNWMKADPALAAAIAEVQQAEGVSTLATIKDEFLTHYRATGHVGQSCKAAGISRTTLSEMKAADPDFAAECRGVIADNIDDVESIWLGIARDESIAPSVRVDSGQRYANGNDKERYGLSASRRADVQVNSGIQINILDSDGQPIAGALYDLERKIKQLDADERERLKALLDGVPPTVDSNLLTDGTSE